MIDKEGTVIDAFESPDFDTARDQSAYAAALAKL